MNTTASQSPQAEHGSITGDSQRDSWQPKGRSDCPKLSPVQESKLHLISSVLELFHTRNELRRGSCMGSHVSPTMVKVALDW